MPTKRVARRPAAPARDLDEQDIEEASENGDEDEQEAPRPVKKVAAAAAAAALRGGWGDAQKQMESTSSWAQAFKPDEKSQVIKFLEDTPYVNMRRHWIERTTKDGKTNRAYTCLLSFDKPCPLCEIGDKPQAVSCFNIAICDESGGVTRKSWDCGARLFNVLKSYANDPKIAPLTKNFFLVSRTGKKGSTQYNVVPVKPTALEEDYDIPVPSQAALDALDPYTVEIVDIPTTKTLRELAEELVDDYE